MFWLIGWIVFALIVGCAAKFLHPGEDPIGCLPTIMIGVAGSFVGGALKWLLNMGGPFTPAGLLWGIVGGVISCFLYSKFNQTKSGPEKIIENK